jgi:hypothetical protein
MLIVLIKENFKTWWSILTITIVLRHDKAMKDCGRGEGED